MRDPMSSSEEPVAAAKRPSSFAPRVAPLHVIHLITDLDRGGAEYMLYRLLGAMSPGRFDSTVISMTDKGPVAPLIERLGVEVLALGMGRGLPDPRALTRLSQLLSDARPSILQTWMYHAGLMGSLAALRLRHLPVVWGLHSTLGGDMTSFRHRTRIAIRTMALLSYVLPAKIVCCGPEACRSHQRVGFASRKMMVIYNGFSPEAMQPVGRCRDDLLREMNIPIGSLLVGRFARYHPMKDYPTFIQAASIIAARRPEVHFILCGEGVTNSNPELGEQIARSGLRGRAHLLGLRDDAAALNSALDVAVSSSLREGFPLVIGEAMAAGTPCVATDVGDSSFLIGDTGRVVRAGDPVALAARVEDILNLTPAQREHLGRAAQRRIEEHFSITRAADAYSALYFRLATRQEAR